MFHWFCESRLGKGGAYCVLMLYRSIPRILLLECDFNLLLCLAVRLKRKLHVALQYDGFLWLDFGAEGTGDSYIAFTIFVDGCIFVGRFEFGQYLLTLVVDR